MSPLIVANWKMNPPRLDDALKLYKSIATLSRSLKNIETVVCPPSPFIEPLMRSLRSSPVVLGGQNIHSESSGAFTGEVSGSMLYTAGARFVIVGHSERRAMGEDDELVSRKVLAAYKARLTPIVCVGESVRDSSGDYLHIVARQLEASVQYITGAQLAKTVIAYEPVWAIGDTAKKAAEPRDVEEMTLYIRRILADRIGPNKAARVRILYGGSVNAQNALDFLGDTRADGLLVGRASVTAQFLTMLKAVNAA